MAKKIGKAHRILLAAGLASSYWGRQIIRARRRGRFTKGDYENSADWIACACGKLYLKKPFPIRDFGNALKPVPRSAFLEDLGMEFKEKVWSNDFIGSALVLVKIENYQEVEEDEAE